MTAQNAKPHADGRGASDNHRLGGRGHPTTSYDARPLPPFGRAVEQALIAGRHPNVYLFAGPGRDAWGLARARQSVCGPASALVLPPGTDPASYRWPALPDLIVDMTGLAGEAVQRLARALVRDGVGLAYLLDAEHHARDLRIVAKAGAA